jgi:hypothetical protein
MDEFTREDIVKILKGIIKTRSQKEFAEIIGISPQYLHDVINMRREPGKKILDYLGYEKVVMYKRAPKHSDVGK